MSATQPPLGNNSGVVVLAEVADGASSDQAGEPESDVVMPQVTAFCVATNTSSLMPLITMHDKNTF